MDKHNSDLMTVGTWYNTSICKKYIETCLESLLEMQELADIISYVLLMHTKNQSIRTWLWKHKWWLTTTIKLNNRSIRFAQCNHIFHWFSDKSLRTQCARTLSYVYICYDFFLKIPVELSKTYIPKEKHQSLLYAIGGGWYMNKLIQKLPTINKRTLIKTSQ